MKRIIIIILLTLAVFVLLNVVSSADSMHGGYYIIMEKNMSRDDFYITAIEEEKYLGGERQKTRIQCDEEQYNNLIIGRTYRITFTVNRFFDKRILSSTEYKYIREYKPHDVSINDITSISGNESDERDLYLFCADYPFDYNKDLIFCITDEAGKTHYFDRDKKLSEKHFNDISLRTGLSHPSPPPEVTVSDAIGLSSEYSFAVTINEVDNETPKSYIIDFATELYTEHISTSIIGHDAIGILRADDNGHYALYVLCALCP